MSYRLIDANDLSESYPEVHDMPCIYADLPRGLDGGHYDMRNLEIEGERVSGTKYHLGITANKLSKIVTNIERENARLRELLQRLLTEYRYMRVRPRAVYLQHEGRMRAIEEEMRELGISDMIGDGEAPE